MSAHGSAGARHCLGVSPAQAESRGENIKGLTASWGESQVLVSARRLRALRVASAGLNAGTSDVGPGHDGIHRARSTPSPRPDRRPDLLDLDGGGSASHDQDQAG